MSSPLVNNKSLQPLGWRLLSCYEYAEAMPEPWIARKIGPLHAPTGFGRACLMARVGRLVPE
jgi:hypothetical protein